MENNTFDKKRILITYFEPFHGRKKNSSKIIVESLFTYLNDKDLFPNLYYEPLSLRVENCSILTKSLIELIEKLGQNFDYVLSMGEEFMCLKAKFERTCNNQYPQMYFVSNDIYRKSKKYWKINSKDKKRKNISPCNQVQNILYQYSIDHNFAPQWEFIHFPKIGILKNKKIYIGDLINFLSC